jgi:hypothetical protein
MPAALQQRVAFFALMQSESHLSCKRTWAIRSRLDHERSAHKSECENHSNQSILSVKVIGRYLIWHNAHLHNGSRNLIALSCFQLPKSHKMMSYTDARKCTTFPRSNGISVAASEASSVTVFSRNDFLIASSEGSSL